MMGKKAKAALIAAAVFVCVVVASVVALYATFCTGHAHGMC